MALILNIARCIHCKKDFVPRSTTPSIYNYQAFWCPECTYDCIVISGKILGINSCAYITIGDKRVTISNYTYVHSVIPMVGVFNKCDIDLDIYFVERPGFVYQKIFEAPEYIEFDLEHVATFKRRLNTILTFS